MTEQRSPQSRPSKKVLVVTAACPPMKAGKADHSYRICTQLAQKAADVHVLTTKGSQLPKSDSAVLSSDKEGLLLSLVEAMACGVPVVAFETGGIPDMIRHGATGLLAPRHDVAALKASLKDLSQHPAKRQEMGAKSREIALQESPCPSKPDDALSCTSPSSSRLRKNYVGRLEFRWSARVAQQENTPAGCSKMNRVSCAMFV